MTRKKRKKSRTKRISFKPRSSRKKKKRKIAYRSSLTAILKVSAVVCVLAAVGIGFVFLGKYVKKTVPASQQTLTPKLVNPPTWVNERLKEKVYSAAGTGGEGLKRDEDTARSIQEKLSRELAWLDKVKVQVTNEQLLIEARWRKPLALIKWGLHKFYVDADRVVLDYLAMPDLPIVKITGLSIVPKLPPPGEVWQKDDLAAATAILARLDRRDKLLTQARGLLYEINRIDVSNFNGIENSRAPHIVLYAKDNTEIVWGAELTKWQQHLESTDEQKIAKLYGYYKEHGTLLDDVKYINLCDPRDDIPLPIDKY